MLYLFTSVLLFIPSTWAEANDPNLDNIGGCQTTKNQSHLNSFLWTIKSDPPSYFFGTIHVPYTRVWTFIPENMKEAFHRADMVNFELDLTNPYTISSLAKCQLLPQGEYLSNILPRDIYRRLKRHLDYVKLKMPSWMTEDQKGRGLYADYLFNAITGNWERKRPVWIMLMVNSLTEGDIKTRGTPVLDLYLAQEAERLSKLTGAVEEVEEQCVPLNDLNFSQVLFALNQTLWQHESSKDRTSTIPYTTDDLISHYNCGDLNSVIFSHDSTPHVPNLVNNSLPPQDLLTAKRIDNYFREELIHKRNQRMAERVIEKLTLYPNKSIFFAFGAGHFLGNNSVIDRLKAAGYEVEHTPADQEVFLGSGRRKRKKHRPQLLADMATEDGLAPVVVSGTVDYLDPFYNEKRHRHRHQNRGRRKGKKKEVKPVPTDSYRLKRPQFNDLWVRLEASSFGPNAFFKRQQEALSTSPIPTAEPVFATNTNQSGESIHLHHSLWTFIILIALSGMK